MLIFCGSELLDPRPTPKLEDNPLSAVRERLFSIFTAALHSKTTPSRLSVSVYSVCSQLLSMSGGRLLHLQSEDTPCLGGKDPLN